MQIVACLVGDDVTPPPKDKRVVNSSVNRLDLVGMASNKPPSPGWLSLDQFGSAAGR